MTEQSQPNQEGKPQLRKKIAGECTARQKNSPFG